VQDVIVSPELRGRGFGARIMDRVMGFLEGAAEPGAFVGLMAAQGVEVFYERYGFRRRQDDRPGMFIVWDR
jgi:predicted GNAT family N-acyltransferase